MKNTPYTQPIADDFIGQRQRRIEMLKKLKTIGVNPYPAQSKKTHTNQSVHTHFNTLKDTLISVAGRITKIRLMGKLSFLDISDETGNLQIICKREMLDEKSTQVLKLSDRGDFINVSGIVIKSQTGEISVLANTYHMLTKSLRPLPNTFENKEDQFRRRYLDMTIHPEIRILFKRKALFWQSIRTALVEEGFVEVFLPVMEHTTGGADARPFVTHHNDLDEDFYLRISLELYSKRCIGAGFEKVFTIGPVFRNEGMSDEHANEFNHIEWYWAYADYRDQMRLTQSVITKTAQQVFGTTQFTTRGHSFDLAGTWQEIDYVTVIQQKFGIDLFTTSEKDLLAILNSHNIHLTEGAINRQRLIDNLWKIIRKTITGPAFLVNHPAFMSPLSKPHADNPKLTERFQVIIAGTELANGYTEINDPLYQLEQFKNQESMRQSGDDEAQMLDIDFIEMLEYGMPPTTGLGFSERLFWFLADVSAREGSMFPLLRRHTETLTKKIYPFIK